MKATISKGYKFLQLVGTNHHTEIDGLRVFHKQETNTTLPRITTDLIQGQVEYELETLPDEIKKTIYRVEIMQGDIWYNLDLKNNNKVK